MKTRVHLGITCQIRISNKLRKKTKQNKKNHAITPTNLIFLNNSRKKNILIYLFFFFNSNKTIKQLVSNKWKYVLLICRYKLLPKYSFFYFFKLHRHRKSHQR